MTSPVRGGAACKRAPSRKTEQVIARHNRCQAQSTAQSTGKELDRGGMCTIDVSITMGTVVSCNRICRQSSNPSIFGIKTSLMTMSGLHLWNLASASSPSPAAMTKQLSFSRRLFTNSLQQARERSAQSYRKQALAPNSERCGGNHEFWVKVTDRLSPQRIIVVDQQDLGLVTVFSTPFAWTLALHRRTHASRTISLLGSGRKRP